MKSRFLSSAAALALFALVPVSADAAVCVNKFLRRTEGPRQVVTLLTGKLTFQEAQALSQQISSKQAGPVEWVDDKGKTIARQFGELKVIRPMPVGCDGKTSGVVATVVFATGQQPSKKISIKLDANTTVIFDEQAE
ncbi:MAG TPA: hypothetical protein VF618_04930 [Thermoanaerobaculia bacterium]